MFNVLSDSFRNQSNKEKNENVFFWKSIWGHSSFQFWSLQKYYSFASFSLIGVNTENFQTWLNSENFSLSNVAELLKKGCLFRGLHQFQVLSSARTCQKATNEICLRFQFLKSVLLTDDRVITTKSETSDSGMIWN